MYGAFAAAQIIESQQAILDLQLEQLIRHETLLNGLLVQIGADPAPLQYDPEL